MGVFLQTTFTDIEGDTWDITIEDDTYTAGVIEQVQGKAVLEYPKVKTMDMLRGSVLKMDLEADTNSGYFSRLIDTVGDKKLPVKLYKNDTIFWNGFIKPDGIIESFVSDYWIVQVQAIDGLGLLENISFLNDDGNPYQGAMSELEIIGRCLELTGQSMNFRQYAFNLYFTIDENDPTAVATKNALRATFVNADRYVKKDNEGSVFTAKEVLESVLKKYGAFICQYDNKWHIMRVIDYINNDIAVAYKDYDLTGTELASGSTDHRKSLGSQIDSYDPHHANANQQKTYKPALGAYKVFYEYGILASILDNYRMLANNSSGSIDDWSIYNTSFFDFTLRADGFYNVVFESDEGGFSDLEPAIITTSNPTINEGEAITLKFKLSVNQNNRILQQYTQVKFVGDSGTDYYLNSNGEWTLSQADIRLFYYNLVAGANELNDRDYKVNLTINTNSVEEDGYLEILFYRPVFVVFSYGTFADTVIVDEILLSSGVIQGVKGESFTAKKIENATAVVDSEDKIFVGDNESETYIGKIENVDGDNTIRWSKVVSAAIDTSKQFKLLDWLARDRMTISSGNSTVFKGGIYGFLPYIGVLSINNITGKFMTTYYKYDLARKTIDAEHERVFTDDIYSQVTVEFKLETDNIVKPAIE